MRSAGVEQSVFIRGPVGQIEARWMPAADDMAPVAVVCHPHPLHGGSMDNKVVTTLVRAWRDAGMATLRFNFRGTGLSEGQHAHGEGEIDDLLAVAGWLSKEGFDSLCLAGFSFGAWVAAAAVPRLPAEWRLERLVLVAPPVQYSGFRDIQLPEGTLVLQGDEDEVVDPAAVREWVLSRSLPPELIVFPGAGHFFHGRLTALKAELGARLGRHV
ncbi:MAG: alpha/beta hydrolase [Pseudomonadota bacterium]